MTATPFIDAATVARLIDHPTLVERLRHAFVSPPIAPSRLSIPIPATANGGEGTLLVMPALRPGGLINVKLVAAHPHLGHRPRGSLSTTLLVLSATDGSLLGLVDGHALTALRTAATSVLAASLLARPDARRLLILGAGSVAFALAQAYVACRSIDDVTIWARRPDAAEALVARHGSAGVKARIATDLGRAAAVADIISAATASTTPLLTRSMVAPGTHIDLVGGFTPAMREVDDALVAAARVVADSPLAVTEAGDLAGPVALGRLDPATITTLASLIAAPTLRGPDEITLFKSVGLALEDLAAAELLFERLETQ